MCDYANYLERKARNEGLPAGIDGYGVGGSLGVPGNDVKCDGIGESTVG